MTKPLTPKQFWLMAAGWGSAMTSGDPGACLYGFDENGLVQSEAHRQQCITYIEDECRKAAEVNIAAGADAADQHGEIEAMLAYLKIAPVAGAMPDLDGFTKAYVTAALWSTNDEANDAGGAPLDENYGPEHIAADTLGRMIADCARFQEIYGHLLTGENCAGRRAESVEDLAGRDFWLNRNGHGAGFWDGDWENPAGAILDDAAKSFGEYELYVGDDGRIHGTGGVPSPEEVASLDRSSAPAP